MNYTLEILLLTSFLGAFDVFYYHIYTFKLYKQPSSVYEQLTHLARAAIFVAVVGVIAFFPSQTWARDTVLFLGALDLLNNAVDVLLERDSRAPLGGLPSFEYLIHILASFLTGIAAATFWWTTGPDAEPIMTTTFDMVRAAWTMGVGTLIFATESLLFARAIAARQSSPAERRLQLPPVS